MFDRVSEVLPLAMKPIRYTGGEYNSLAREPGPATVDWVLAMPEVYELGMSNYGLRILYSILNRTEGANCDRVFLPWPDFAALLGRSGIPLYSLETHRPVREFDVLGVSLQSELSYTNVLSLLDLAGIPLNRGQRTDADPIVVAGGPCTVNPLPLAAFVDAFVVGDGEEPVVEITRALGATGRGDRGAVLELLATIPGVFVPGVTSRTTGAVRRRVIPRLREADFPLPPLLPICEITHDRLTVEIARGCARGCRFCQAGMINRPVRYRPVDDILRLADRGIRAAGWEEVSLLALSALDYPGLSGLVRQLNARLKPKRVSISLPSTRGEDFSPELAFDLQEVRKGGLTFAPETISARMKALINKDIPESATLEAVRTAIDAGWNGVKLYFMVGLPCETDADIDEIARFVDEIARLCRGRSVRYNMSPFVPKPHTPLQWCGFAGIEAVREKIDRLKSRLTRRNIRAKWEDPASSYLQALLARGDERLGPVIERVFRAGGVFQEWTEHFDFSRWLQACAEESVDPEVYVGPRATSEKLPWELIDIGVDRNFLAREYERSVRGEMTGFCGRDGCTGCGACPDGVPPSTPVEFSPDAKTEVRSFRATIGVGEPKQRFRLRYEVGGSYRFAAHLDRVRAFYRALRRSELPVLFTRGFSPKPMMSFGPPLPVGLTSGGEYADISLGASFAGDAAADLGPFLPRGMRIVGSRMVPGHWPTLGKAVNLGRYRVPVPVEHLGELVVLAEAGRNIAGVRRMEPGPDGALMVDLAIAPGIRLLATLAKLFGIEEDAARSLAVHRVECLVDRDGRTTSPMED